MSSKSRDPAEPAAKLDGFWDAVVERLPANSIRIPAAQPEDASTVRRLHALAPEILPEPTFSDRLLADLLGRVIEPPPTPVEPLSTHPSMEQPSMQTIALDTPVRVGPMRPSSQKPWFARLELVATVLIFFGFAAMVIRQLPDRSSEPVTSIPAVMQSGTATPDAASGDVPTYQGDVGRTGQMAGPGPQGEPVERWTFATGGLIDSGAAVVDGTVVIGSNDAHLYALDVATGEQRWAFATSSGVDGSPAVVDGVVYVGTQDGTIYAVDFATGTQLWSFPGAREGTSPLVAEGKVFVGSWDDKTLFALDAKNGEQLWTLRAAAPFIRVGAYADGTVFYPSREGVLHAVDAASGAERWSFTMDTPVDVDTPVVHNGIVYQPTFQAGSTLYALDADTGAELWRISRPNGFRSPAVDTDTVYLPSPDGGFVALDSAHGDGRWSIDLETSLIGSPSLSGGVLYVSGQDANVYALDASTGAILWQFRVDQKIDRAPAISGGALFVGTAAGTVYALEAPSGDGVDAPEIASPTPPADSSVAFDPATIEVVWQSMGGDVSLNAPEGLAIAPDGSIYVVDARNNMIQIIDPANGAFIDYFRDPSGVPIRFTFTGNFGYNGSLGFDEDGNLYVFDFNSNRVQTFDPTGNLVLEWGTEGEGNGQFQLPLGYVDAENGLVYVAEIINSRVQVFDLDGNYVDRWGGFGTLPGQFNEPDSVTLGPDGSVYVTENSGGRIQRFDANGVYLGSVGEPGTEPGQLLQPNSTAVDNDGNVIVADFGNGRLQIFRPDGSLIGMIDSIPGYAETISPSFVRFDADGKLLVSDEASNSVFKLELPPLK